MFQLHSRTSASSEKDVSCPGNLFAINLLICVFCHNIAKVGFILFVPWNLRISLFFVVYILTSLISQKLN